MERFAKSDDLMFARVKTGQFQRVFICFSATVAEKQLVVRIARNISKLLREFFLERILLSLVMVSVLIACGSFN